MGRINRTFWKRVYRFRRLATGETEKLTVYDFITWADAEKYRRERLADAEAWGTVEVVVPKYPRPDNPNLPR